MAPGGTDPLWDFWDLCWVKALLVLYEALMEVVRVGLRDPSPFSFRARRDVGQLLAALGQDGPISLAHGQALGLGQDLARAPVDPVAGLAQQRLHQARPAEAVGLDDKGEFAQKVRAAQLMLALVTGEVRRPAVVDQRAGVARDDADLVDRLPSALAMQELQGQGSVGDDMEPLGLAVDPEAGLVGMQGRAFQEMRDGGLLP